MKHISLFITLGIFSFQTLQAVELCTPQEVEHPNIKERARTVHFADGHHVTLIGHVHGERKSLKNFAGWVQRPDDELSTNEWRDRVEAFIKNNEKTLTHAKQDLGFLRATLWNAQEPIFVAVESQDDDVAGHVQRAMKVRSALAKEASKREIENTQLLRDAELIYMGGVFYSHLYDSELKQNYELLGMEGTEEGVILQKQGKKKMRLAKNRLAKIKENQGLDQDIVDKAMAYVVDEMNASYDDVANILAYDHEMIRGRIEARYRNLEPKVRGAVLSYLFGYLDVLRGMKKRDVFFSRKLTVAAQKQSGIFYFGEEHLESIGKLLELDCHLIKEGNPIIMEELKQEKIDEM